MNAADYQRLLHGDTTWAGNYSLGGCKFYGEFIELATFGVWLSNEPITPDDYACLEAPDGFRKSGIGRSQHDAAFFRRAPGADIDGPLDQRDIGGRIFSLVARPGRHEPGFEGVIVLPVEKSHRLLFVAGRTVEVIDTSDGMTLIHQASESHLNQRRTTPKPRRMPTGWTSRMLQLNEHLVIDLPCPARVAIFDNGDIFHGPITDVDALRAEQ